MDSRLPPLVSGDPPPIPVVRTESVAVPGSTLLLWVRTGAALVRIDDDLAFRIAAGEGLWIPPAAEPHRTRVVSDPGSIVFPLWPQIETRSMVQEPTVFEVPDAWQDWLIQHYNLMLTPLHSSNYSHDDIADVLRRSAPPAPPHGSVAGGPVFDPPDVPRAEGARAVAEELIRDPALSLGIREWASRVLSSPSTLLRDFLADTGLTFEQWRLQNRLSAAIGLLADGYSPAQVSAQVGFASLNGFTRAFRQRFALTPYRFRRALTARGAADGAASLHGSAAPRSDDFAHLVRGATAPADEARTIPEARTPPHAGGRHILSWMYRGSGYLDIGERRYERARGVATWIPADVEHVTGLREDSISLPIGTASTAELQLAEPLQARFPPAWDEYLMFCSICSRTTLRPDGYDSTHIIGVFAEQLAAQRALSVPMPTDPRARAAAMDYLERIGVSAGREVLDVPADVRRAFLGQTGMSFARWRYAARMRIARDLLAGGAKTSAVALRVGYGHVPNFSAAFSRFHGVSPREYQERESEKR